MGLRKNHLNMLAGLPEEYVPGSKISIRQTPIFRNLSLFCLGHVLGFYGVYLLFKGEFMWQTIIFNIFVFYLGDMGTTAGAHRLWAHQSYKAKEPLKLLLLVAQTIAFQDSVLVWVRDHRLHHKHTDSDADPHNSKQGFLFSHIKWLLTPKTDAVLAKSKTIAMSDLEADPHIFFQHKYYWYMLIPASICVLVMIPVTFWGEHYYVSLSIGGLRFITWLHCTFLVNSAAHMWGFRPYDKSIGPAENKVVSILTAGEGWHNYHHVFPWDYKTSELGDYKYNFTTAFIDFFAMIGWAYDLKSIPKANIKKRVERTGDGSWNPEIKEGHHSHPEKTSWGWGDKDISKEDKEITQMLYSERQG